MEEKSLILTITENGEEGESKMIASCGSLEGKLREGSEEEGVTSVETLGVDLRTIVKRLGAKEKARRKKYSMRFSLIKKTRAFKKSYMKVGVKKLLRMSLVPARACGAQAVGIAPTDRLKLRRQMTVAAAAAGKTELNGLAVEEEVSMMAKEAWEKEFG